MKKDRPSKGQLTYLILLLENKADLEEKYRRMKDRRKPVSWVVALERWVPSKEQYPLNSESMAVLFPDITSSSPAFAPSSSAIISPNFSLRCWFPFTQRTGNRYSVQLVSRLECRKRLTGRGVYLESEEFQTKDQLIWLVGNKADLSEEESTNLSVPTSYCEGLKV